MYINDSFLDELLLALSHVDFTTWFANIVNYLAVGIIPLDLSSQQKKRFLAELMHYLWEDPILYSHYVDKMIRRCILESEMRAILQHCHSLEYGGHFSELRTAAKEL